MITAPQHQPGVVIGATFSHHVAKSTGNCYYGRVKLHKPRGRKESKGISQNYIIMTMFLIVLFTSNPVSWAVASLYGHYCFWAFIFNTLHHATPSVFQHFHTALFYCLSVSQSHRVYCLCISQRSTRPPPVPRKPFCEGPLPQTLSVPPLFFLSWPSDCNNSSASRPFFNRQPSCLLSWLACLLSSLLSCLLAILQ